MKKYKMGKKQIKAEQIYCFHLTNILKLENLITSFYNIIT